LCAISFSELLFCVFYSYVPLTVSYGLQLCPFDSFVWFTVMSLSPFRIVYSYVPLTVSYGLQFCPFDSFVWFTVMSLWQFRMVYSYVPLTVSYGLQLCPFDSSVWFTVMSLWQFHMFKRICVCFFIIYLYMLLPLKIQLSRWESWNPINWFNPAIFLCLS
jgi:hypothetical protein